MPPEPSMAEKTIGEIYSSESSFRDSMKEFCDMVASHVNRMTDAEKKANAVLLNDLNKLMQPYNSLNNANQLGTVNADANSNAANAKKFLDTPQLWENISKATLNHQAFTNLIIKNKGFFDNMATQYRETHPNAKNVGDYAIMPVQRGPRYVMLFDDLIKRTKDNPEMNKVATDGRAIATQKMDLINQEQLKPFQEAFNALKNDISFKLNMLASNQAAPFDKIIQDAVKNIQKIQYNGDTKTAGAVYTELQKELNGIRAYHQEKSTFGNRKAINNELRVVDDMVAKSHLGSSFPAVTLAKLKENIAEDLKQKRDDVKQNKVAGLQSEAVTPQQPLPPKAAQAQAPTQSAARPTAKPPLPTAAPRPTRPPPAPPRAANAAASRPANAAPKPPLPPAPTKPLEKAPIPTPQQAKPVAAAPKAPNSRSAIISRPVKGSEARARFSASAKYPALRRPKDAATANESEPVKPQTRRR